MRDFLRKCGDPIVIFGASVACEAVLCWCADNLIKVAAVCDNNKNKQGKDICGIKIISPENLPLLYPDARIIICVNDIADIVEQLGKLGCKNYIPGGDILRGIDISRYSYSRPRSFAAYVADTCILAHDSFKNPGKVFIRSVDIVITERCSLHCRDCSNLMQYYRKPQNYDKQSVLDDIERLCSLCEEINEFRIIGGEPLMNPDWHEIVSYAAKEKNVHKIVIYTNGTILPDVEKLRCAANSKCLWLITDYGDLSRNIDGLCDRLDSLKIAYVRTPAANWSDCSSISFHRRNADESQKLFDSCCVKNSFTLMRGNLYRCPFSANADILQAIPESLCDRLNIRADHTDRAGLRSFILRNQPLVACNYCSGRPWGAPVIPPALQYTERPKYKKFPRNDE